MKKKSTGRLFEVFLGCELALSATDVALLVSRETLTLFVVDLVLALVVDVDAVFLFFALPVTADAADLEAAPDFFDEVVSVAASFETLSSGVSVSCVFAALDPISAPRPRPRPRLRGGAMCFSFA